MYQIKHINAFNIICISILRLISVHMMIAKQLEIKKIKQLQVNEKAVDY